MKVVSALFLMAAIVLILAIFISARAGDAGWVQVWAALLGVLAVARAVEILIEERVKS
jgi:DMSO reductase anchor subunit